jgi:hypothetical protein
MGRPLVVRIAGHASDVAFAWRSTGLTIVFRAATEAGDEAGLF